MTNIEVKTTRVPSFADIPAVIAAQQAKKAQLEADLYPRDGSRELFQLEKDLAEILGVRQGNLLLYNTGMSAVVDALEIMRPTAGTVILKGNQHYSQAGKYITDELRSRDVSVLETDPGSLESINKILERKKPSIVFFETVTNGSEMATLDVKGFLDLPVLEDLDPLIVLDNTLPTSTALPLGRIMAASPRKVVGIESGTKFIGLNTEMCGMAYTYDADSLLLLRKRRQRTGSLLSASAVETVRECMPKTVGDYDLRNSTIFRHTLRLARACCGNEENGDSFVVIHPNLQSHPSSQYTNLHCPDGISPVFFIQPMTLEGRHYQIAEALWENPIISELCDLGQSFGFNRSRIWPDDNAPVVRVSGGIYSEEEQAELDKAFSEVLSNLK